MIQKLSLAFLVLLITSGNHPVPDQQTQSERIIMEGTGIDSFVVQKTTPEDVIKILGTDYEKVVHGDYSIHLAYKNLGLRFYYYQSDIKEIFCIEFEKPFVGKTSKGIILNQSTMEDVIRIYGEPDWTTCDDCDTWSNTYEGVEFEVERDKSLPQYPLNEAVHVKKKIIGITVMGKSE